MFSIDHWIAAPPFSVFFSLFIIAALDFFGTIFLHFFGFAVNSYRDWVRWQAPIVGAMLLAIVLYPLALLGHTPLILMQSVAIVCMFIGVCHLIFSAIQKYRYDRINIQDIFERVKIYPPKRILLFVMLTGMGLLALGPVTNADALDYHMGVAIAILNHGGMPVTPEWFIGRLAGNGEVLNALALSVGAEQFGSLLQYFSLLGIFGIIFFANNKKNDDTNNIHTSSDLIALAAFSAPTLIFLVSAPKHQMWPIAMTTLAFTLLIYADWQKVSRRNVLLRYILVCILVMTASQAKFNYLLGGLVVGLLAFGLMIKNRFFWSALGFGILTALLVLLPPIWWKVVSFNSGWVDVLIHPLPGKLPGTEKFISMARNAQDINSALPFPLMMFLPTNIGAFSTLLGIGAVVFIALRPDGKSWIWMVGVGAAITMIIATALLAPPSSRMYLEPYFWLMIILSLQNNYRELLSKGFLCKLVLAQAFVVTIVTWLGALVLLPGALRVDWRIDVMQRAANGYEVMQWADTVLPKNAVVLNGHRSMSLIPRNAVSYDWINYVDVAENDSILYLDRLKERAVTHMLILGGINPNAPLFGCLGNVLAGPGVGHTATRNPFNRGGPYEAWIVEFNYGQLPQCAQIKKNNQIFNK